MNSSKNIWSALWPDDVIARRYRAIISVVSMLAHLPFIFGRYLPRESLTYFSGDENALIRIIERYQAHMTQGHWGALLSERLDYGYGYLFYLGYSVFTYPFAIMAGDEGILAAGRLISTLFECGTILLICMMARRLGAPAWLAVLLGVAMAFTPGLIVMHKPLSAEQLSNFLIVSAAWSALAMPRRSLRGNLLLISVLAGAAVSVKFNAALTGVFFVVIVLFRIYQERVALLRSAENFSVKMRTLAVDFTIMISGLLSFFLWNFPIVVSEQSRNHFAGWLLRQAESNQNSQRGAVNYQGMYEWWPQIDVYFGDIILPPLLLISCLGACVIGLLLKKGKDLSFFALLTLLWIVVPAAYVILTVKKIWLWYLVLPGLFLLLGPALLYIAGKRLREAGAHGWGGAVASAGVLLLIAQIWAAAPDYGVLASERWGETNRSDFVEMEAMRVTLTDEVVDSLNQTSMIVDPRTTLPVEAWRKEGARITARLLPDITQNMIAERKPDYIVIRYWGYAHHRGNIKKALADFDAKLQAVCRTDNLCYEEHKRYQLSRTLIFKLKPQATL